MEVVYPRCSGLDVHKRFVVACLSIVEQGQRHKELRQVSTMTGDILVLKAWLQAAGCRQIAIESTGVFWKPLYHLLEDSFEIVLVNAQHMRIRAGAQNGCERCGMAGGFVATRLAQSQFHPRASSNRRCVISPGPACA